MSHLLALVGGPLSTGSRGAVTGTSFYHLLSKCDEKQTKSLKPRTCFLAFGDDRKLSTHSRY